MVVSFILSRMQQRSWIYGLVALVVVLLAWSGIQPYDRATWWMEVAPIFLAAPILWLSRERFPLTSLLVVLIAAHAIVLLVGGAYTYARVPIGFWVQEQFALSRNPYDKLGHFMQGFVPALVAREIFVRQGIVRAGVWPSILGVAMALSVSLIYELIEWGAAVALGQGAEEFLGTQGDVWDTQSDMGMAFVGALVAVTLLGRWHDRQMAEMQRAA
jgi:putative membrane protein